MSNFEKASRLKLRFPTTKGSLNVEDLWDLSLPSLDLLAKSLNKQVKEGSEESFIKVQTRANEETQLKFDLVLHTIKTKMAEQEAALNARTIRARAQQLRDLRASKETEALGNKSLDDINTELAALEAQGF